MEYPTTVGKWLNFFEHHFSQKQNNYSIEEITEVLEVDKRVLFIKKNWNTMNAQEIADALGIHKRTVFKLVKGQMEKKKHVVKAPIYRSGTTILDTETGVYYDSMPELAKAMSKPISSMNDIVNEKNTPQKRFIK